MITSRLIEIAALLYDEGMNGWPSSRPFAVCFLIASLITFGMSTGSSMGLEDNHAEIPNIIESLRAIERSEFPKQEIEDWLRQEEEKTLGEIESIDIEVTDLRNRIESLESARQNFQAKLKASEPSNSLVADSDRNFWSFRRLSKPSQPEVTDPDWARTPIDRFILAGLEERGLSPTPRASKQKLIRRLYFDLIGLPPSPEEVQSFVEDDSPSAYEDLVDRLLDSPHYGERWGRHWLDLARYADSGGYEFDIERPTAYHFRDAVIKAFNEDLPYDTFLKWQLAGDEYEPGNPLALALTGFCTSGPTISNQVSEKNRYDELDDMLSTVSSAMLGLTVACARCHDHKYDAIPSRDYYQLLSVFTSSERKQAFMCGLAESIKSTSLENEWTPPLNAAQKELDNLHKPYSDQIREEKIAALPIGASEMDLLRAPLNNENAQQRHLYEMFGGAIRPQYHEIKERLSDAELEETRRLETEIQGWRDKLATLPPKALTLTDKQSDPVESFFLARGDPNRKVESIQPGFLTVLKPSDASIWNAYATAQPEKTTGRRTALAEWITDPEKGAGHLAARVLVNRLWQHHLGRGLVGTPSDFGVRGDRPTHPELLDWLAVQLIEDGWSVKKMHKRILMSAVYQQDSTFDATKNEIDPDNHLWWRRRPIRMESEVIRDTMLAVAGNLNRSMYGPGIKPRLHPDLIATGSTQKWPTLQEDGPDTWRRSVYIFIRRSVLMPLLTVFDGPDATQSCSRRQTTTIPLQSLELLNDRFARQQAESLATRLEAEVGQDARSQINRAFWLTLSRPPFESELENSLAFLETQAKEYEGSESEFPSQKALVDFCQAMMNLNEFVYVD
ncbi:MAG: DUF1553 domain-containing protein [Candidatus Omnitrophica bacterium]|nr:DUF1553 domain-containing protein [Candidatus Omnitrophota bacterium]